MLGQSTFDEWLCERATRIWSATCLKDLLSAANTYTHFFIAPLVVSGKRSVETAGLHEMPQAKRAYYPAAAAWVMLTRLSRKGLRTAIEAAKANETPSQGAKIQSYIHQQADPLKAFYDGRYAHGSPASNLAHPVELYCSVFARLKARLSDSELKVPPDLRRSTEGLMRRASKLFFSGTDRSEILASHFRAVLGASFSRVFTNGTSTGSSASPVGTIFHKITVPVDGRVLTVDVPHVVVVENNEPGTGDCDPAVQAALSMLRLWLDVSLASPVIFNTANHTLFKNLAASSTCLVALP